MFKWNAKIALREALRYDTIAIWNVHFNTLLGHAPTLFPLYTDNNYNLYTLK